MISLVRLNGIEPEKEGIPYTEIIAQGCYYNCPSCNRKHRSSIAGGFIRDIDVLVKDLIEITPSKRISIQGGEPFLQVQAFGELCLQLKQHGFYITVHTEFKMEELMYDVNKVFLLNCIDLLFEIDRGTGVKRIISVQETLRTKEIILF